MWLNRHRPTWGPAAVGALTALGIGMWASLGMPWAWRSINRVPDTQMEAFTRSRDFFPGATYRVLRAGDGKVGMYQLVQAAGALDSEFFPESILRQSWPGLTQYSTFLRHRLVDYVMIWRGYTATYHVNEEHLLDELASQSDVACSGPLVCVHVLGRTDSYSVYVVTRS